MFKRLMIGLVAVGLVVIFIAEAANAITTTRRRRSVETTITCTAEEDCQSYSDLIAPVDGEICAFTGTLICAPRPSGNGDFMEAFRELTITIEDCKKGQRKGHYKDKGKGHEKKKGKGHTQTCPTTDIGEEEGGVPPPEEEGGLPAQGDFEGELEVVFESEIPDGDALCEQYFPGEDLVFVTFWINEFYGITELELGGGETEYIYQYCELPADPDEDLYDCVDIPDEEACDVIPQCGEEPIPGCGLPPEVDMVFALDLTGSMSEEIDEVKAQIGTILTNLEADFDTSDFRWGVISYMDYEGYFSGECTGYAATYGNPGDVPYRLDQDLTDNSGVIVTTVNGLTLGSGGDGPQSYATVFWEAANPAGSDPPSWRPDALKLLVNFGDNLPHDTNLKAGLSPPPSGPSDTGVDPGPNGDICEVEDNDDIDFQDDGLQAMIDNEIRLLHIDSSLQCEYVEGEPIPIPDSSYEPYWRPWAESTNGEYAAICSDGAIPGDPADLYELILELLGLESPP